MFKSVFYDEKGCLTHSLFLDNKKKIHFLLYFILLKIVSVFFMYIFFKTFLMTMLLKTHFTVILRNISNILNTWKILLFKH